MPPPEGLIGAAIIGSLILYLLFGGADFGGGVWDLLASGPRAPAQRRLVERAIGPVWEANHVWLILVVVLLFTGFPKAFAAISVALHVPLTLFLLGIVLRGSAFAFRSAGTGDAAARRWGVVFAVASLVSPLLLGVVVAALASGRVTVEGGTVAGGFFAPWLAPFPVAVGLFCLALCAFLAATYLALEASSHELREDFRRRALLAGLVVAGGALLTFLLSTHGAPRVREGLTSRPFTWPLHAATGAAAVGAFIGLWIRRYQLARICVAFQTAFIVIGWAASQYPYLVVPQLTIGNAAANPRTLWMLVAALAVGLPVLFPCLYILFRIFKSRPG